MALPFLLAASFGALLFVPGAASASVLCKANETPCSAENVVENGTGLFVFSKSTPGTPECEAPHGFQVTDIGGEGKAVKANLSTTSMLTDCDPKGFLNCGTEGGNFGVQLEGSSGNGTMVLPPLTIKAFCTMSAWKCTTETSVSTSLEFTGGFPATVTGTIAGTPCARSITYTMYGPGLSGLYIVGGAAPAPVTRLCKVNTSPCPDGQRHLIGTTLEGSLEGESVFEFLYEGKAREPACEGGTLTGKTTAAGKPLIGEVSAMSFSSCGAGVCAVEAQSLPYKAEIEKTTGGNGTLALVSGGGGPPKIEVNCGKAFKCIYKASSVSTTLTGGSTPKLAVAATMEKDAASEAECGSTMTWKATYKLTKPTPLYVTS